jgi:hypothetical protein
LFSSIDFIKIIYFVVMSTAPGPHYMLAAHFNSRAVVLPNFNMVSEIQRLTRLLLGELFLKPALIAEADGTRRRATVRQHEGLVSLLASVAVGQLCAPAGLANR